MTYSNFDDRPVENIPRGTIFTLIVIPLGIIAWVLLWNIGFIASIVSYGVAFLAVFLYQKGSGGPVSRTGAIRVTIVVIVTVLLSLFAGIVSDIANFLAKADGTDAFTAFMGPDFWATVQLNLSDSEVIQSYLPQIGIALAFAALGCYSTLRRAFRATSAAAVAAAPAPLFGAGSAEPTPPAQQPGQQNWGGDVTPPVSNEPSAPSAPGVPPVPRYGEIAPKDESQ